MPEELTVNDGLLFLAIFFRVGTMLMMLPVFGHSKIPPRIRVMIALIISLLMAMSCRKDAVLPEDDLALYPLMLCREVLIGMIIGFVMNFLFSAHQVAGRFIDVQLGYGMANIVDPISNIQTSILSRFNGFLAIAIFLSIDGHHLLLNAVHNSLEVVPFEPALVGNGTYRGLVHLSAEIFVLSLKISAPVVVTLILTDVGMGIIARIVPQMNVFIVGFPMKILFGVAMLILAIPFIIGLFEGLLFEMNQELNTILYSI